MRIERIIWIVALLVVGGVGFYSGQIIGGRLAAQNRALAAQQFFSQRGSTGQGGQGGQNGQGGQGGAFRGNGGGAAGTVSEVSGNTISITTRNGQTMKVQLAADGTVRKQVDGQLSDIKQGDQIIATGTQNGDTFEANSIQIGGFGGGFGGGRQQQNPTAAP
jgi:preprotein translocase subunit YajC